MGATITILFSKKKIFLWLIAAIAFVAAGSWLLFGNPAFGNALPDNPWFIKILGIIAILFFAIAACFFIISLKADGPGLIIDDTGINDHSSAVATKIYWKDVESIEAITIQSQPIILFKVNNPQTYINRAKGFKQKTMMLNYKWYGTPLSISANSLQISFDELLHLISDRFEAHQALIKI